MLTAARVKKMDNESLKWTMKDLMEVITIQEEAVRTVVTTVIGGVTYSHPAIHCPNLGRYHDELGLCITERNRRLARGSK